MSFKTAFKADRYQAQTQTKLFPAQVLNPGMTPNGEAKPWGFAIEEIYAKQIAFSGTPEEGWHYYPDYQFKGKEETTAVYVNQAPSLLVLSVGDARLVDRATNVDLGFLRGSEHHAAYYSNRAAYRTYTRNLIFFVGEDNRLLHEHPLSLRIGGAAGGTFSDELSMHDRKTRARIGGFQFELLQAYWEALGETYQELNDEFFAYWVFSIQCKALSKGSGSQSNPVCCTVGHAVPTVETLEDFYINPESEDGRHIAQAMQRYPNFGKYLGNVDSYDDANDRKPATNRKPAAGAAPKPKKRLPDVSSRPSPAVAEPEYAETGPTIAMEGTIEGLITRHELGGRGWLALFILRPQNGEAQACYATGDLAHNMHQLYHNGSLVAIEATPVISQSGIPRLRINNICATIAAVVDTEPLTDTSEILVSIDLEIARLGWTKRQGSAYLQTTYGKKTRAELTDDELISFLKYLKLQTPVETP